LRFQVSYTIVYSQTCLRCNNCRDELVTRGQSDMAKAAPMTPRDRQTDGQTPRTSVTIVCIWCIWYSLRSETRTANVQLLCTLQKADEWIKCHYVATSISYTTAFARPNRHSILSPVPISFLSHAIPLPVLPGRQRQYFPAGACAHRADCACTTHRLPVGQPSPAWCVTAPPKFFAPETISGVP